MKRLVLQKKLFYQFESLPEDGLFHFSSTKKGWGGDGKSRFTGDVPESYSGYRRELAAEFDLPQVQFVFPRQTHSNQVAVVDQTASLVEISDTDALVTNQPGLCICVQTADCVPIVLFDPVKRVIAAIHSGWRGTVQQIARQTISVMADQFGSNPGEFLAGIGPSISAANYEVGPEVVEQIQLVFPDTSTILFPSPNQGKAYLDLWEANRILLSQCGVPDAQIEISGLCTRAGDEEFYSARRDGADTGRMVTGILLR